MKKYIHVPPGLKDLAVLTTHFWKTYPRKPCHLRQLIKIGCEASLAILFTLIPTLAHSQIESVTPLTPHPSQYGRTDFVIMLKAHWDTSPYTSHEVLLDLKLVSPSGKAITVPAYFDNGSSGINSEWLARFTPIEAGEYTGTFVLTNGEHSYVSKKFSFQTTPSDGKGFLHVADKWTFRFDNGQPFRGIGENIGWESRVIDDSKFFRKLHENLRYNYEYMLGNLAADGGNFFRTWMSPLNLPLEWKIVGNTNRYSNDSHYFNASAMERMDQLVNLIGSLDLYMMLTIDTCRNFQGAPWEHNNYNQANGGPAATPQDFFTDPKAKAQYKDRLRYLVARWGYSPHIAAWEFFNEIDNLMYGLPKRIPDDIITAWHTEMSDYMKSIDPYHHLVTTSISHRKVAGLDQIPSMDFDQLHIYGHNGKSRTDTFPEELRHDSQQDGKPYVVGEFGFEWDWSMNFDDFASDMDGDFKKGLWLGLFSPTPVLPMSWWWEYFDHRGVTPYIGRVRSVLDQMLAAGNGSFADAACQWTGPSIQSLAVKCGKTYFALLSNEETNSVTGNVSLSLEPSTGYQVAAYDPELNVTNTLPPLESGNTTITGVSVKPANYLILIISPEKNIQAKTTLNARAN